MKQYIDKDALVAEIEKLQLCTMDEHMNYYSAEAQGEYNALSKLESFIDALEVKEIGVDLGDPHGDKSARYIIDTKTLEVKEVETSNDAFINKASEWLCNNYDKYIRVIGSSIYPAYSDLCRDFQNYMKGE